MIERTTGDILTADVEALVNTVNCVGPMGRGIALQFKQAWPENYRAYAAACRRNEVQPGRMFVFETGRGTNPRFIINFPTKRHWRGRARLEDIDAGLAALIGEIRGRGIRSVAIPPLGCGLGGLDWSQVRPRIEEAVRTLGDVRVVLFEPSSRPAGDAVRTPGEEAPAMTTGRAALLVLMDRYLRGLLDPSVSLLEIHKLMYFMQEAGEPLRLRFSRGPYGPYADNLRHVLRRMEGHFVAGYGGGGDEPGKPLEPAPGAAEAAHAALRERPESLARFERVTELVDGFESPFGLELLATVHWLAVREGVTSAEELIAQAYAWAPRKRRFSPGQIRLAMQVLREKGWLTTAATVSV